MGLAISWDHGCASKAPVLSITARRSPAVNHCPPEPVGAWILSLACRGSRLKLQALTEAGLA